MEFNKYSIRKISSPFGVIGFAPQKPLSLKIFQQIIQTTTFTDFCLGKDEKHCEWAKKLIAAFNELQPYLKQHYKFGLVWNAKVI